MSPPLLYNLRLDSVQATAGRRAALTYSVNSSSVLETGALVAKTDRFWFGQAFSGNRLRPVILEPSHSHLTEGREESKAQGPGLGSTVHGRGTGLCSVKKHPPPRLLAAPSNDKVLCCLCATVLLWSS